MNAGPRDPIRLRLSAPDDRSLAALGDGTRVCFTSDGRWLVAATWEGRLELWPLRIDDMAVMARLSAGQDLMPEELQKFNVPAPQ